jgi:hypothetical protein
VSSKRSQHFTAGERCLAGAALVIAVIGQLNEWNWQRSVFGLDATKLSIVAFLPALLIVCIILQRAKPRSAE